MRLFIRKIPVGIIIGNLKKFPEWRGANFQLAESKILACYGPGVEIQFFLNEMSTYEMRNILVVSTYWLKHQSKSHGMVNFVPIEYALCCYLVLKLQ